MLLLYVWFVLPVFAFLRIRVVILGRKCKSQKLPHLLFGDPFYVRHCQEVVQELISDNRSVTAKTLKCPHGNSSQKTCHTSECSAAESNKHLILTDLREKRHWKRTHWLVVDEAIFSVIGSFQGVSYTKWLFKQNRKQPSQCSRRAADRAPQISTSRTFFYQHWIMLLYYATHFYLIYYLTRHKHTNEHIFYPIPIPMDPFYNICVIYNIPYPGKKSRGLI